MTHPREQYARRAALALFDRLCPYVVGNPYIPHWPTRMQVLFLGAHLRASVAKERVFECLYGGAAGGGKSDALLMAAAQYAWKHPSFRGVCIRRTYADLAKPGALMDRAIEWWVPRGVQWNGSEKRFTFPSGAVIEMAHMSKPLAHLEHQGANYHLTAWDELTQQPTPSQYEYVGLSRVRRAHGSTIPLRTLSASNPGGPGHVWVKRRFIGGTDPVTGQQVQPQHLYIRALLRDNPHLDRETYAETLRRLHPTLRDQLLNGDWSARDPGDYFRAEWFGPLLDPIEDHVAQRQKVSIRWWDLAASVRPDAARTAGVKMSRFSGGLRAIEHAIAFRATPGARDDRIEQIALADGHGVYVGIEIEPGSGGPAQFEALRRRLRRKGLRVVGARPREQNTLERAMVVAQPVQARGKMGRADPVASCLEAGFRYRQTLDTSKVGLEQQREGLRLYAGAWTQEYLDEIEGFPDATRLDFADAMSGAWAWLEAHPFGLRVAPERRKEVAIAELQNVHPADRPERNGDQTASGHWRI